MLNDEVLISSFNIQHLIFEILPLKKSTVNRLAKLGKIRAYKPGKEWLFDPNEIIEDLKQNFKNDYGNTQAKKRSQGMVRRLQRPWRKD